MNQLFGRALIHFRYRKKYTWEELSDWKLALIGAPSFLVGAYYLWVVGKVMPDFLEISRDHALTPKAVVVLVFLGGLALSGLVFMTIAKRCYELLYKRNFK
ncbi:hypothetical protein ACNFIA_14960 [Pseudomonas sp. NY15437]|uniref:hypothetical protein n=1 Tax=Pseudomonas sp. NY15437 TaxID=3400360 RepID=UPI003A8B058C